jgi:hypothetical protein
MWTRRVATSITTSTSSRCSNTRVHGDKSTANLALA